MEKSMECWYKVGILVLNIKKRWESRRSDFEQVFVCVGGEGGSGILILFRIGKVISGFFDPAGFIPEI